MPITEKLIYSNESENEMDEKITGVPIWAVGFNPMNPPKF